MPQSNRSDPWDPALYERFREEREQPALDLIALVRPRPGMRVVDLGCGTGAVTERLHLKLRATRTVGVDRSEAMLARATARKADGLSFVHADLRVYEPAGEVDLVFSNAALQWVEEHDGLLARLRAWLAPEGQLAVQVPAGDRHPTHTVAKRLGERYGVGPLYAGERNVLPPERYAQALFDLGFRAQEVVTRVYAHVLPRLDEIVTFFSSTLLAPCREALGTARFQEFLRDYRRELAEELGEPEPILLPIPRTFLWARL